MPDFRVSHKSKIALRCFTEEARTVLLEPSKNRSYMIYSLCAPYGVLFDDC